jgi:hypothetical protein
MINIDPFRLRLARKSDPGVAGEEAESALIVLPEPMPPMTAIF